MTFQNLPLLQSDVYVAILHNILTKSSWKKNNEKNQIGFFFDYAFR